MERCLALLGRVWPPPPADLATESALLSASATHLGRFGIVRLLGQGGCGIVLLAWDPLLEREVALKVPRMRHLQSPEARRRFLHEARLPARLSHPNLVPIHETGEAGEVCYIASEYFPGPNLAAWLREQSAPVGCRDAARFLATLARAVQYIHEQGALHRDLKPSNILLTGPWELAPGEGGLPTRWVCTDAAPLAVPKITDFGLAKDLDRDDETPSGAILGTPLYMSPEQAAGQTRQVGPQSDVYSLGAILYELLTGQPPFRGPTDLDTLRQLLSRDPAAPRSLRPDIPADLEMICVRCLEPAAGQRYGSAGELAGDLERFLAGEPVLARPLGRAARVGKWCLRRPAVASLAAALGLFVILGTLVIAWQWRRADARLLQSLQAADQYFERLNSDPDFENPALQPARKELLLITLQHYREFLRQRRRDPALEAKVAEASYRVAFLTDALGDKRAALQTYQEALACWKRLRAMRPGTFEHTYFLAKTYRNLALIQLQFGEVRQAEHGLVNAMTLQTELSKQQPARLGWKGDLVVTLCHLGALQQKGRRNQEAFASFSQALAVATELLGQQPQHADWEALAARCHYHVGSLSYRAGQWEQARESLSSALRLQEDLVERAVLSLVKGDLAATHRIVGQLEMSRRQPELALEHQCRSLALCEELTRELPHVTANWREMSRSLLQLARMHKKLQQGDEELAALCKAAMIYERLVTQNPDAIDTMREFAQACTTIAELHQRHARLEDSLVYYDMALEYYDKAESLWSEVARRIPADQLSQSRERMVHTASALIRERISEPTN